MWEVLETAKNVAKKSRQVQINKQALVRFSRKVLADGIEVPRWNSHYHFCGSGEATVSYLLVLDSLNFCFWPAPGKAKWEIEYESRKPSGYYALAASLKGAIESGAPVTRAESLVQLSLWRLVGLARAMESLAFDRPTCRVGIKQAWQHRLVKTLKPLRRRKWWFPIWPVLDACSHGLRDDRLLTPWLAGGSHWPRLAAPHRNVTQE